MKRIISLALCVLMLLPHAVYAQPKYPVSDKEEVIYAKMRPSGVVEEVFVVNAFLKQGSTILDYGDYTEVLNLTDMGVMRHGATEVFIETDVKDFFYQGKMRDNTMPWEILFRYELDGVSMSPEALMGQSGDLAIHVQVRKNEEIDPVFFENYMLQISIELDQTYFSDIRSEGATIASSGEIKVVNLTSLPGKEGDFLVEARVDDAHLGQIQIAGLPFELFMELPNIGQYTDDLVQLKDAIAQIAEGVEVYIAGVGQLNSAALELEVGVGELYSNVGLIREGYTLLHEGSVQFDEGLRQYSGGVQEFKLGMDQLLGGIGSFSEGIGQLNDGSSLLAEGLNTYGSGMSTYSSGIHQTAEGSAQLSDGIGALSEGLGELTYQGKYADPSLVSGSEQILSAFEMMESLLSFDLTQAEADLLVNLFLTFSESFNEFVQNVEATDFDLLLTLLREGLDRFDTTMRQVEAIASDLQNPPLDADVSDNPQAQELLSYMSQKGSELYSATEELRAVHISLGGLDPLLQGLLDAFTTLRDEYEVVRGLISRMNEAIQSVKPEDLSELKDGLTILSSSYRQFHEGLVQYVDGVESAYYGVSSTPGILSGSQDLAKGLQELDEAGEELAQGASELADGMMQLDEGLGELRDGADTFVGESSRIASGVEQLADGSETLSSSHAQLIEGDRALLEGLWMFEEGMEQYSDGFSQFSQGIGELAGGGRSLSGGANTLRNETSNMDEQMRERIEEAMSDYLPGEYTLISFTDERNTGIQKVQFIYLSESQTEEEIEEVMVDEPQKSLWEKFLDLFRWTQKNP